MRRIRNPRYAPECLERKLSPSTFIAAPYEVSAEVSGFNPDFMMLSNEGDPPLPPIPPIPEIPPPPIYDPPPGPDGEPPIVIPTYPGGPVEPV